MPIGIGCVVKATAGRDADGFYVVCGIENGFVLLADGKRRKLEKPKKKNVKHVRKTNMQLDLNVITTDKGLRRALSPLNVNEGGNQLV
ncbi:KOW domain-containing RNA-binding protein [Youxingia wuxianensis]|uniref:KOW domain-containing RNA-binding protein n=1 Tax=Youxingia wuxianensis TaxID=2763678 RepID=A0A926II40_9FIRM|nr:KOW domain-containing RNA-binding protein [Youxingia wuxianensis]MBC8585961.1 KOW domain-containing RNA-binding protein [Youxingia wuxianensis]